MTTLSIIDAVEQRLVTLVAVGAVAYCAADPTALPPKWAAAVVAISAVAAKLAPSAPAAPAADEAPAAPTPNEVNAELP